VSWSDAAALPSSAEAALGVLEQLGLTGGETLLILGAAGSVGMIAAQLAVSRGATVIGAAAPRDHELVRDLGAVPVSYGPGLADRVREIVASVDALAAGGTTGLFPTVCSAPLDAYDAMLERMHRLDLRLEACQSGTEGSEPHPGLEPKAGERVVIKHRYDGFFDTDLNMQLQAAGVKTLIVTGVAVHGCVDSTIRHAYFHGYYVVLVEDLTGGAGENAYKVTLDSVNLMFGVTASADEIIAAWPAAAGNVARADKTGVAA